MKCPACDTAVGPDLEFCPSCHWELVSVPSTNKALVAYMQKKLEMHRRGLDQSRQLMQDLAKVQFAQAGLQSDLEASRSVLTQRERDLAVLRARIEQHATLEKQLKEAKEEIKRLKKRPPPI